MKVEILNAPRNHVSSDVMEIGDVAIIRGGPFSGYHILRCYACWLILENPRSTWSYSTGFDVEILPEGTEIKLTL